jgi:hypothetical protein
MKTTGKEYRYVAKVQQRELKSISARASSRRPIKERD